HHSSSNLVVHEVIGASGIDEDGDWLLFEQSSHFHRLRVCIAGKSMHHAVGWLWFLLCVLLFVLRFFNKFDHEEPPFLATIFAAPWLVVVPTQAFRESITKFFSR
ncbi:hypothetical protein GW17_00048963, partial [Ensete ventricosum]